MIKYLEGSTCFVTVKYFHENCNINTFHWIGYDMFDLTINHNLMLQF